MPPVFAIAHPYPMNPALPDPDDDLEKIYHRYGGILYRLLLGIGRNQEEAELLLISVFEELKKKRSARPDTTGALHFGEVLKQTRCCLALFGYEVAALSSASELLRLSQRKEEPRSDQLRA